MKFRCVSAKYAQYSILDFCLLAAKETLGYKGTLALVVYAILWTLLSSFLQPKALSRSLLFRSVCPVYFCRFDNDEFGSNLVFFFFFVPSTSLHLSLPDVKQLWFLVRHLGLCLPLARLSVNIITVYFNLRVIIVGHNVCI